MLLDCAQILKGSGFFARVRVPSAGSWGGRPGRGWVGAAGVGATASLGMTEGGWLGESVWVLRWLHTLCWELLWLSFLSNWCWLDRKQREREVYVWKGRGWIWGGDAGRGQREEKKVRGISKSVIRTRFRVKEMSEKGVDGGQRKKKLSRLSFLDVAVEHLSLNMCEEKWLGFHGCETKTNWNVREF